MMAAASPLGPPPAMITSIMRTRLAAPLRSVLWATAPNSELRPSPSEERGCSPSTAGGPPHAGSSRWMFGAVCQSEEDDLVDRDAGGCPHGEDDSPVEVVGYGAACLDEEDDALAILRQLGHGRAAARADPVQTIDDALQGVRVVVSTVHDENILGTPGDVELSFVHEAQVSGVEPVAVFGGGTTIQIAVHDAGALHPDASISPLGRAARSRRSRS